MNGVVGNTQNWVSFTTVTQPTLSVMEAFAAWVNGTNQRYLYVPWDSNVLYTQTPPQAGVLAQIVAAYNGVSTQYDATGAIAAFVCSVIASINYDTPNSYVNFAARSSALLTPDVTDETTFNNVTANGANCYANVATANQLFQFYQTGQISGDWNWIDEYVFQIWLNNGLQLSGMTLLANTPNIPFNSVGAGLISAAYLTQVKKGVAAGGIQSGVQLSDLQIAEVNLAAGAAIDSALYQKGYYLQVNIPDSEVQDTRGPWPATLWYVNAGGVNTLEFASINVQ
jgi:hypothetical protein